MSDRGTICSRSKPAPCSDDTRQVLRQAHERVAVVETSDLAALVGLRLGLGHGLKEVGRELGIDRAAMKSVLQVLRDRQRRAEAKSLRTS